MSQNLLTDNIFSDEASSPLRQNQKSFESRKGSQIVFKFEEQEKT